MLNLKVIMWLGNIMRKIHIFVHAQKTSSKLIKAIDLTLQTYFEANFIKQQSCHSY